MALSTHSGGAADKAGNIHEALWGVRGFRYVLEGDAGSIRIEEPGEDGAEFYLQKEGRREYWQVKRQITGQKTWSITSLKRVLTYFLQRFREGGCCVFASVVDAPELRMLEENAKAAETYAEFDEHFLSKERRWQFKELKNTVGLASDEEAFAFLQSVTIHGGREITLEPEFGYPLGIMFQGPWQATLDILKTLYLSSSHETLTASDIEQYLLTRDIPRRGAPNARQRVLDVTKTYVSGQRAKLILARLIRRTAAEDIVDQLNSSTTPLDILVTSPAGGGKSACMYQIVEGLQAAEIPVLAFRLDRVKPVASAIQLGEELGLTESPTISVAEAFPAQPVVILVDQLDCVSTTSGRHPDFFDTIAALKDELTGLRLRRCIHLVLACRKFDYEHDHRLKQLGTKDQTPIELGELSEDEVKAVFAQQDGDYSKLNSTQQAMLRLPQNLALFVDAGLAQSENTFTTPKELCDAYWRKKKRSIADENPAHEQHWLPVIERLASTMSERQELSVRASALDQFPQSFLDKMSSEGVLTWDGKRYGFGHETFFDYCFARTQPNGGRDFVTFLESDAQHLFRRAQLRQVMAFLRDDDFDSYLTNLSAVLSSERIRPHLKLLAVDLVAAHPLATEQEFRLLQPWIEAELDCRRENTSNPDRLGSRIWDRFFSSRTLFVVADEVGLIQEWLDSEEPRLLDTTVHYLRWQTHKHAERVAELLEPFIDNDEWRERLRHLMEGHDLEKSRRYFELFLRLLEKGVLDDAKGRIAVNDSFWSMLYGLAEAQPSWCAELAARWLDRRVALARPAEEFGSPLDIHDQFGAEDVLKSAEGAPVAFLEHVLPAVLRAANTFALDGGDDHLPRDHVWLSFHREEHIDVSTAFTAGCESAFKSIGNESPQVLRPFIDQLKSTQLYTANHLLISAFLSAPETFAEEALQMLVHEPRRLHCGFSDSAYWQSRKVIHACSPYCTKNTFELLENVLLEFVSPYERTKKGMSLRGHAAYNLVSAMDSDRLSRQAKARISEWENKFEEPDGPPAGIRSYFVGSPIEEESAQHMTDEQWLKAIATYDSEERRYDFQHPERGGALELARTLQKFTAKEPERFARFALKVPDEGHPYYLSHILRGLKGTKIPFRSKLEAVRRVFGVEQTDCIKSALDLLRDAEDVGSLPADAVEFVRRVALHPDPEVELWDGDQPRYGGDILTYGINTVRGHAAEVIRDLIFSDRGFLTIFCDTIEGLVVDPNLGVRSCVASTLQAVANHDVQCALNWSAQLFECDDRLLSTRYVQDFISRGLREHWSHFAPTIERMLNSEHENVQEGGGSIASLARLHHDEADHLARAAIAGPEGCRMGVCEVAERNLLHPDCRPWCESTLTTLFADEAEEIRKKAARSFWHLWKSPETPLADFDSMIRSFLSSPAFADDPTYLLHALEETKHQIPEAVLDVCEAFIDRCAPAARDIRTSFARHDHTVGKLVFTVYAQLQSPKLQNRALDLIDRMNLEGLYSANTHLAEFER